MQNTMIKARNKKGFTLVEMLIVIAIIAILIAIAIPVYTTQMEKAREAVDSATLRSAKSLAVSDYMLNPPTGTELERTYTAYSNPQGNIVMIAIGSSTIPDGYSEIENGESDKGTGPLTVTVTEGGSITATTWAKLDGLVEVPGGGGG